MKKIIMIFLSLSLSAFAMSYKEFKKYAEKNARLLQSQALSLKIDREKSKILLRTKNPILDIELSEFNPDNGSSLFGYSSTITQTVRTGNYYGGLEDRANASMLLQKAYLKDGKAGYMRKLEMLYTQYIYQYKFLKLLEEEYKISNKVANMVKQKYQNGSENRVAYLQAKTDTLALKTDISTTKQSLNTLYYQLLAVAGLEKRVSLSKRFIYPISESRLDILPNSLETMALASSKGGAKAPLPNFGRSSLSNPIRKNSKEMILKAKEKLLESQIKMNSSSLDSYDLYMQMENEPEQSVVRVGISMPLPIFNNKSEERRLAKLKMMQLSLDKEQLNININSKKQILKSSIKELYNQYSSLKILRREQQTLYKLLQEGYKIAQGSLFVMMSAKNKLIQTQKSLLKTQVMINNQKIELRFIQGAYND